MAADPIRDLEHPPAEERGGYAGGPEMTLIEHLIELRNRVLISAAALLIGCLVCFFFWETILGWLIAPARADDPSFRLSSFSPVDRISAIFKIGLYGGLILASPVVVYELLAFIVPGLTPRERKLLAPGMFGVVVFLAAGMAFAYWIILPQSLSFLLDLGSDQIQSQIGIRQYMDFVTRIIFFVGIAFELPMVLALAAKLRIVRAKQLVHFWRYAIVIVFVLAAIITPTPDPFNQALVGGPLLVLYFVGVLFAWILQPKRPEAEAS